MQSVRRLATTNATSPPSNRMLFWSCEVYPVAELDRIYNATIYPGNLKYQNDAAYAAANFEKYFRQDVKGRVAPLGNYTSLATATEYFFGLAPDAGSIRNFKKTGFAEATIAKFSSDCPEVAAASAVFTVKSFNGSTPQDFNSYIVQTGFWQFDEEGKVKAFDLALPGLQEWVETATLFPGGTENPAVQQGAIQYVCATQDSLCLGKNKVYDNVTECIDTLKSKKFGNYDNPWQDSVTCRTIHINLAGIRPDIHCPHIGPTGGMACVDATWNEKYGLAADELLYGETMPFICPDKQVKKPVHRTGVKGQ